MFVLKHQSKKVKVLCLNQNFICHTPPFATALDSNQWYFFRKIVSLIYPMLRVAPLIILLLHLINVLPCLDYRDQCHCLFRTGEPLRGERFSGNEIKHLRLVNHHYLGVNREENSLILPMALRLAPRKD